MADQRQVPSVPATSDPVLRNFLSAVREAVNAMSASVANQSSSAANQSSSAGVTSASISALSTTIAGLLDTSTPPAVTGLAVQGMRVNNFVTWNASTYANLSYTEIWRAPALMNASSMTVGGSYTINVLGTTNWSSIGATVPAITALVNGTKYIITALGTINWTSIGLGSNPVVGATFTYNGTAVSGSGGTVLTANFTLNSTPVTGTGGVVVYAPVLSSAVLVGTSNGHIFVDSVDPGSAYAYWVRFVSNANIDGPFNASTGVIGSTSISNGNGVNGYTITAENLYAIQAWISSADILDAAITNAKISGTIQSDNYNGSTLGWSLDKTGGNLNLNQLTIRDNLGNVILASGTGVNWGSVSGTGIPADNATRNVFQGNWATAVNYVVGDIVMDSSGYGWSCILDHTSSATVITPVYPIVNNTYWTLYTVKGSSAIMAVLSNDSQALPADSSGVVSSYAGSTTLIYVYEGGSLLTYDGVGTANGKYTVTAVGTSIIAGAITALSGNASVAAASAMTADTASITFTITGKTSTGVAINTTKVQSLSKSKAGATGATGTAGTNGTNGTNGTSVYIATVYQQVATQPSVPTGGTYNFSTNTLTPPAGWSIAQPTTTTVPTYAVDYLFSTTTPSTTVIATTWSNERIEAVAGASGSNGVSIHVVELYQQAATAPALPTGTTYNFSTDTLTGTLGSWLRTMPPSSTTPTYVTVCTFTVTAPTVSQTNSTWSTAVVIAQNGATGAAGTAGAAGAQGPSVVVNANLPEVFTATDGTLDAGQANIVFTALVSGITTPTYVWTFSGFQTAPTNSGTSTQTITAAQFGTSKSAIVTCTVNGVYLDTITVVRLEKTTAAAGATVGATIGVNLGGQINSSNASTYIANASIQNAQIGDLAVDTLQIKGNAVTVPLAVYTAAGSGTAATIQTLVIPVISTTEPTQLIISFGFCATTVGSGGGAADYRTCFLNVNGSAIFFDYCIDANSDAVGAWGATILYTLPINTSITLTMTLNVEANVTSRYITAISAKR